MNDRLTNLIAQYEQEGDFTHKAPTKDMLVAAERLLGVTIPQQFVEFLHEYSYGGIGGVTILGTGLDGSMAFLEVRWEARVYSRVQTGMALPNSILFSDVRTPV